MNSDQSFSMSPSSQDLKKELERSKRKRKGGGAFVKNSILVILAIAAIISILTTMFFPIMSIHGNSMAPTVKDGSITVAHKQETLERGDVCAFYSGNSILCKRVIAFGGEVVSIDDDGVIYIDGVELDEPYLTERDFGNTNITFPYTVPEHTYFVMGDNRSTSIDSRNTKIGCISEGQIIGKLIFCFWPFDELGTID